MKFKVLRLSGLAVLLLLFCNAGFAQKPSSGIIPQPVSISFNEGRFVLDRQTEFVVPEGASRIRAVAVQNGKIVSKQISFDINELAKRMTAK